MPKKAKMLPYLRIETLKTHPLSDGTYLSSPYMAVKLRLPLKWSFIHLDLYSCSPNHLNYID